MTTPASIPQPKNAVGWRRAKSPIESMSSPMLRSRISIEMRSTPSAALRTALANCGDCFSKLSAALLAERATLAIASAPAALFDSTASVKAVAASCAIDPA